MPHCDSLMQQIDRWFAVLRQCDVDVPSPSAENCFDRCPNCRSRKLKKKDGGCKGGSLRIDINNAIRFVSSFEGYPVSVVVTAVTQWAASSPNFLYKHNVEVQVSVGDEQQNYKAHLDLATNSRREPLFHLQAGGFRVEKVSEQRHFGFLRWPAIPLDLILVTELVLFTFQPDQWEATHQNSEFLYVVRQSERQFLTPFFHRLWDESTNQDHSFIARFRSLNQNEFQTEVSPPKLARRRR